MRSAMMFYRLGAAGILLTAGVFFQEPLYGSIRQNPSNLISILILFGFPVLAGLFLLGAAPRSFEENGKGLMIMANGAALLSIFWIILWCFVWLAIVSNLGEKTETVIKRMAYLNLFGVGFSIAAYFTGWMAPRPGEKSARFFMAVGWAVSYMAWFNLFLQPALKWLWASAMGGLLVVLGAFLIFRHLKRRLEATSQLA
jgi:hypothetical protein